MIGWHLPPSAHSTSTGRESYLAHGIGDGGLGLSEEANLARLAAQRLGGSGFDEFAARTGASSRTLMRAALAAGTCAPPTR
jgi:hypothetical protein